MRTPDRRVEKLDRSNPTRTGLAGGHNASRRCQRKNRGIQLLATKARLLQIHHPRTNKTPKTSVETWSRSLRLRKHQRSHRNTKLEYRQKSKRHRSLQQLPTNARNKMDTTHLQTHQKTTLHPNRNRNRPTNSRLQQTNGHIPSIT